MPTPQLVLGPIVRFVEGAQAVVWIETDRPCEVEVAGGRERTFAVAGHHYGVVVAPARAGDPYEVRLDGELAWPLAASTFPPSRFGRARGEGLRIAFGSCRTVLGEDRDEADPDQVDALAEYARRAALGTEALPDLLVFLGDQVYDRKGAPATRAFIRSRRDPSEGPGEVVADFEEYTRLYWEAWQDPPVRWLLSTVPSLMIFDDHDILDNWNTSEAWVEQTRRNPWGPEQIRCGLMAYWLYQHLGNLTPAALAEEPLLAELREASSRDPTGAAGEAILHERAERWDTGTHGTPGAQWSFARDLGDVRLAIVDSRNGRRLEAGARELLDEQEWRWLTEQARGPVRHLLVGTSVPFLLPPGFHHFEQWLNAVCGGAWGRPLKPVAERLRQDLQFTKWSAFPSSFARLADLLRSVAADPDGPASVLVLSGDVHYSYIARMASDGAPIHQVTSTPLCYDLEKSIEGGFRAGMGWAAPLGRRLARLAGVTAPPADWHLTAGPWFRNIITTLDVEGDSIVARLERTCAGAPGERLEVVAAQEVGAGS